MPANDGTPRTWYSMLRRERDGIGIEHRAFAYDHSRAAAKMRERGLPEGYADALETGLWPNLDILPPAECARTGFPLDPQSPIRWPAWPDLVNSPGRMERRRALHDQAE